MAKRGRPQKFSDEHLKLYERILEHVKTKRGRLNKIYEMRATNIIANMNDLKNKQFFFGKENDKPKCSLLTELGRFNNEENIQRFARLISDRALTEKKNVRQWQKICAVYRRIEELI
jgi:hypothetical protein